MVASFLFRCSFIGPKSPSSFVEALFAWKQSLILEERSSDREEGRTGSRGPRERSERGPMHHLRRCSSGCRLSEDWSVSPPRCCHLRESLGGCASQTGPGTPFAVLAPGAGPKIRTTAESVGRQESAAAWRRVSEHVGPLAHETRALLVALTPQRASATRSGPDPRDRADRKKRRRIRNYQGPRGI